MKSLIGIAIVSVLLSGCFANAGRTSGVHYGMSKQEVVAVMGAPVSVSTHGSSQYLSYSVCDTDTQTLNGIMRPYVVRLIDGRVESYGTTGDVDSSQTPTGRHESDQIVKQDVRTDVRTKEPVDLYTELIKLKELKDTSVITEEEFRFQKRRILEKR
ncbi:MAG: hypothetical protein L0Z46_05000 [Nitrospiraceae bacterium]|nr:hypothetical protein [Nitrospiraceae bacterium]